MHLPNRRRNSKGVGLLDGDDMAYVSRAAYKLASVTKTLGIDFRGKTVLDVGASTGGFSDYALKHGAAKVIAVEKGTKQLSPSLLAEQRIEVHEKTDIRDFKTEEKLDLILIDASFISLREILPSLIKLLTSNTYILAMAKPQFEVRDQSTKHGGVIKNERIRRQILMDLEKWFKKSFVILGKADSLVSGTKGNKERFYLLKPVK